MIENPDTGSPQERDSGEGSPVGPLETPPDATQLKHLENALFESEQRFRAIFENAPIGMALADPDFAVRRINKALTRDLGYSEDELLGKKFAEITHPEDLEHDNELTRKWLNKEIDSYRVEKRYIAKDGGIVWVDLTVTILRDAEGNAVGGLGMFVNVTDRKQSEMDLQFQAEEKSRLLTQIMDSQEAERRQLTMDVHDGPLQSLGVSLLALDRSILRRQRGEGEQADIELRFLRQNLGATVRELRSILDDLSHEMLDQYGLATALQNHAQHFSEATGIAVTVHSDDPGRFPADKELLLYRLAQEALANVGKHSQARHARITLEKQGNGLSLTVADDGRGFSVKEAYKKHEDGRGIGLGSMRHRAEIAGGSMTIESAPGEGTLVRFWCPV